MLRQKADGLDLSRRPEGRCVRYLHLETGIPRTQYFGPQVDPLILRQRRHQLGHSRDCDCEEDTHHWDPQGS
jgi:hypothetical protein